MNSRITPAVGPLLTAGGRRQREPQLRRHDVLADPASVATCLVRPLLYGPHIWRILMYRMMLMLSMLMITITVMTTLKKPTNVTNYRFITRLR